MDRLTCHEALYNCDMSCRILENEETGVNDQLRRCFVEYREKLKDLARHKEQPVPGIPVPALESFGDGDSMQGWWRDYIDGDPKDKQNQVGEIQERLNSFASKFEEACRKEGINVDRRTQ